MEAVMNFKNRMALAASFSGVGIEIGVEEGKFSSAILNSGKVAHLYSIDPWLPIPGFFTEEQAERAFQIASSSLAAFYPRSSVIRADARQAASKFPDESLDFVYIDSSHEFGETYDEMLLWWPKIKAGGILSGHDYANGEDVRRAVNQFVAEEDLNLQTTERDDDLPHPQLITSWIIRK